VSAARRQGGLIGVDREPRGTLAYTSLRLIDHVGIKPGRHMVVDHLQARQSVLPKPQLGQQRLRVALSSPAETLVILLKRGTRKNAAHSSAKID
jgi:hypothetical protein